jgi:chromosome segregation ATPase
MNSHETAESFKVETITQLEIKINTNNDNSKDYENLQYEYNNLLKKHNTLEENLYDSNKRIGLYEKECYDKDNIINTINSDMNILKHDLNQRNIELNNLHLALVQLQKDRDNSIKRVTIEQDKKIQNLLDEQKNEFIIIDNNYKKDIMILNDNIRTLKEKLEDESLLRRKAEIDFNNDKKKMQKTLETAVNQMRNTNSDDVIDRALVTNLFVDYIQKRRSLDVLALIGKILNFTDEQKEAVGLKVPSQNYITSLLTKIVGPLAPPPPPDNVEGDNLAELFG